MSSVPAVTFLVHGGANSIEAIRARGLAMLLPPETTTFHFREGSRLHTASIWNRDVVDHPDRIYYLVNTALPGALLGPWWSVRHRCRYILDTGDAVYEMARQSGVAAGVRLPFLWACEQGSQRRAAAVVVRGTRHQELLRSRGIQNVEVIRDGFAPQSRATPQAVASLRADLGLSDSFVLGVMGSTIWSPRLQICYGWDLLEAIAQLNGVSVKGLIVGDGNGLDWLRRRAVELGVQGRVVFTGRVPYAEVPTYLRAMDVAMSTQTNNLPGRVRTTGKVPEYMAAERFILASRVGEAALILPELMLLEFEGEVNRQYPKRVAERVRLLIQNPDLMTARHALPRLAQELCDYRVLSAKLMGLLSKLS